MANICDYTCPLENTDKNITDGNTSGPIPPEDDEFNFPNMGSQPCGTQLPKEEPIDDLLCLGSQTSFDSELLKLFCNENFKNLSQSDAETVKSKVVEACSKLDSQEGFSLEKIVLGTPPDLLLESIMNSQGDPMEWLDKLKFFSDSQKGDDYNLSDLLRSSQSQL